MPISAHWPPSPACAACDPGRPKQQKRPDATNDRPGGQSRPGTQCPRQPGVRRQDRLREVAKRQHKRPHTRIVLNLNQHARHCMEKNKGTRKPDAPGNRGRNAGASWKKSADRSTAAGASARSPASIPWTGTSGGTGTACPDQRSLPRNKTRGSPAGQRTRASSGPQDCTGGG